MPGPPGLRATRLAGDMVALCQVMCGATRRGLSARIGPGEVSSGVDARDDGSGRPVALHLYPETDRSPFLGTED